jgi:predicted P-loop ATPase
MQNELLLNVAIGEKADTAKPWKNTEFTWPQFAKLLREAKRTPETEAQYAAMERPVRGKVKDVGGYVGGYLADGKRNPRSVTLRSMVTLDMDSAAYDAVGLVAEALPYAYVLHSTHSHTVSEPRYRLILPLDRAVTATEYVPIARRLAQYIGLEMFDETGYQPFRLMFWPSCSSDATYVYVEGEGEPVPTDLILDTYVDWKDVSSWPTSKAFAEHVKLGIERQADPLDKPGVIGAFCRTYNIHEAIEKFLADKYTALEGREAGEPERYTYVFGSAAGGLIVYDDKFTYSHHGTDPTSNLCCNAYDLVRIHLFGDLDSGRDNKRSMAAMNALAYDDTDTSKTLAAEQLASVRDMFGDLGGVPSGDDGEDADAIEWMSTLTMVKGKYVASAANLKIIFQNDPKLAHTLKRNEFDSFSYIFPGNPWRTGLKDKDRVRDVDFAGLRSYIEIVYGISSSAKVDDARKLALEANSFHPVRDYLNAAADAYDGKARIKTLLPKYMGTETSIYTHQAMMVWMTAAVARIFNPGCKFDMVLTLVGPQESHKSTFFAALAGEWFSDTFTTFRGQTAFESLMGNWIVEMGELSAMNRTTIEVAKGFIASQRDNFRPAYGHTVESFPRQCVFGATTNIDAFLSDETGNRRFLPVVVNREAAELSPFDLIDNPGDVQQLWGEAVKAYRAGGKLYLTGEAHKQHAAAQERHSATDDRLGAVVEYLEMLLPAGWDDLELPLRRMYIENYGRDATPVGTVVRQHVTALEVWSEAFKNPPEAIDKIKSREVNAILKQVGGWSNTGKSRKFGRYGKQRYYERN